MEYYKAILILAITPFFLAIAFIFYRHRYLQYSYLEFAIVIGCVFGLLVPLDHILGLPIRVNTIFTNLNHEAGGDEISYEILGVIVAYQVFLLSMLVGGLSTSATRISFPRKIIKFSSVDALTENVRIPVLLILIGLYLSVYVFYDIGYASENLQLSGSLKQIRLQIAETGSLSYKLLGISSNIFFAFCVLLISAKRKSIRLIAFLAIVMISIYRGDRSDILLALIALAVFHQFRRPRTLSLVLIVAVMASFFWLFKPVYNSVFDHFTSDKQVVLSERVKDFSFSRIESLSAFEITHYVLYDSSYPVILGKSYAMLPQVLVPRFIYDGSDLRIGRQFRDRIAPEQRGYFGFSPLAEAYLNFGMMGFVLVGLVFGVVIGGIRFPQRSVLSLLVFYFIFRFFRLDFVSAFKMNLFIYGISFFVAWIIIININLILATFRSGSRRKGLVKSHQ